MAMHTSELDIVKEPVGNPNYLNGVFYFSNTSDEDYIHLWNNIEYTFPAKTCSPMIIAGETPENIQNIRKRFAYDWAVGQYQKSKEFKKMEGVKTSKPPIPNEKVLEPYIQMCLNPLPIKEAKTRKVDPEKRTYKVSKPVAKNENLNVAFKDEQPEVLGEL